MKKLWLLGLISFQLQAMDLLCQSQLLRMDVDQTALEQILNGSRSEVMKGIESYIKSEAFTGTFLADYPMPSMGMPFNYDLCQKEKLQGDKNFRNVDCLSLDLCSNPAVPEAAKKEVCLSLPCSLIVSDVRKCPLRDNMARPVQLHYPTPVRLEKFDMKPYDFNQQNGRLRACADITDLRVKLAIDVEFAQDPRIQYEKIGLEELILTLEGTRKACISAKLDLAAEVPVSDIKIERQNGDFVSYPMIQKMIAGAKVRGLTGVDQGTLETVKTLVLPPMALHFRSTVEAAIEKSLAQAFELRLGDFIRQGQISPGEAKVGAEKNSFTSEFGVSNIAFVKFLDLLDCSLLKGQNLPVPADAACYKQVYGFAKDELTFKKIPKLQKTVEMLPKQFERYQGISSESLRLRLLTYKTKLTPDHFAVLENIAQEIERNQQDSPFTRGVAVSTAAPAKHLVSLGVSFPDICDPSMPSRHAARSIPGCPIQAYIDLDELNKLFETMYESGRLCHQGKGDFVPERDSRGRQVYNRGGSPRGTGCLFILEEDEDGLRCFLNKAPKLSFDTNLRGYRMQLNTRECYRDGLIGAIGRIGGDINFEISFKPAICGQGDFCLENIEPKWNVVEGTARYSLKDGNWLKGIVYGQVNKKIKETIKETIRIPMSGKTGPMALVPLVPEGRTDQGPGFFGACLKGK